MEKLKVSVGDEERPKEGRVLEPHSSAAPQAESTVEVQLSRLEIKLAEHAEVLDYLHARFEEHQRATAERLQALENLLKRALAAKAENDST